jgi:hypothetical protein
VPSGSPSHLAAVPAPDNPLTCRCTFPSIPYSATLTATAPSFYLMQSPSMNGDTPLSTVGRCPPISLDWPAGPLETVRVAPFLCVAQPMVIDEMVGLRGLKDW